MVLTDCEFPSNQPHHLRRLQRIQKREMLYVSVYTSPAVCQPCVQRPNCPKLYTLNPYTTSEIANDQPDCSADLCKIQPKYEQDAHTKNHQNPRVYMLDSQTHTRREHLTGHAHQY